MINAQKYGKTILEFTPAGETSSIQIRHEVRTVSKDGSGTGPTEEVDRYTVVSGDDGSAFGLYHTAHRAIEAVQTWLDQIKADNAERDADAAWRAANPIGDTGYVDNGDDSDLAEAE